MLGRDGTLWDIQTESPAAGHVFAKTGTFAVDDPLNRRMLVTGKGLAGYMTTAQGERLRVRDLRQQRVGLDGARRGQARRGPGARRDRGDGVRGSLGGGAFTRGEQTVGRREHGEDGSFAWQP